MTSLHITNGDSVLPKMSAVGVSGDVLPWRDVLHEGPVPAGTDINAVSEVRAQFIAGTAWGELEDVRQAFQERDAILLSSAQYDRIVLWFEQDLYDQLQLLQLLDWFSQQAPALQQKLYLIQAEYYLGLMSVDQIAALNGTEIQVTANQLRVASQAWKAFTADHPQPWVDLLNTETHALPYLESAVLRMLEEYPSISTGLSRTQRQALIAVESGESRPGHIFGVNQNMEQYMFMGDTAFWCYLNQMLQNDPPLLTLPTGNQLRLPVDGSQLLTITREGLEVLLAQRHWLDLHTINRWIGGAHITPHNPWCWDEENNAIVKRG